MERPIRVGVVGLGRWGPNLARNFATTDRATLVALCDQDAGRAAKVAERYPGIRTTTDAEALLTAPDVDAVVIATPTHTHHALAKQALLAGKHVMVEKPVATAFADARDLEETARVAGRVLLSGHVFLYNGAVRYVKGLIDQPQFGRVLYLHARRTNLGPVREDVHAGWDLASHDISIFLYLLGRFPLDVTASAGTMIREGVPDVVFATLTFPDGIVGHIHTSWLDPQKVRNVTVVGSEQMIVLDDMDLLEPVRIYKRGFKRVEDENRVVDTFGAYRVELVQGDVVIPTVSTGEPLRNECDAFLEAIVTGQAPLSGARLGTEVVQILEAMDESIRDRSRRVALS